MIKSVIRQNFNDGLLYLFVSEQNYEIRQYIRNYYRQNIKFTEVTRPGDWDTWNKKVRYSFSTEVIQGYFNESDPTFVVFKGEDGIVYYKIETILRK